MQPQTKLALEPLSLGNTRNMQLAIAIFILAMLIAFPSVSHAQQAGGGMDFPIIDQVLCGFLSYSRTRLAPLIAAIVVVFAWLGHLLGTGKAWGMMLNVGIGLGVIMGIGSIIARYTNAGAGCLA